MSCCIYQLYTAINYKLAICLTWIFKSQMENKPYSLTIRSYTVSLHELFVMFWLTGTHSHKNPI